jgi:2-phosphosulfolactate phosphatase
MRLFVSLLPSADSIDSSVDVAVVIDVLRATSVIATALAHGARSVVTCREVESARAIAGQIGAEALCCGERKCKRIEGFDLGNSPAEYTRGVVAGKTIVLTTTNGTRAIESARGVGQVFTATFLNLSAVVDAIGRGRHIHLVASGTEGRPTDEDTLMAGAIAEACRRRYGAVLSNRDAETAFRLWSRWIEQVGQADPDTLCRRLRDSGGGRNLIRYGFESDLIRCAQIDLLSVVPVRVDDAPATFQSLPHPGGNRT